MITQYPITATAWTAISAAGESGTAWLDEENDGAAGQVDVRIYHTNGGVPADAKITEAKRIYKPSGNDDVMILGADNATDIFYARCVNDGDTAIVSADVS